MPRPDRFQHPQLPADHYLRFYIHQNLGNPPRWTFPNHLTGNGLRCERLDISNYDDLWPLFAEDPSPFIDDRFRSRRSMYEYTLHTRACMPFSGKRGGTDWLIIDTPGENTAYKAYEGWNDMGGLHLEENERLLGILHLYYLSMERFDDYRPRPFVGLQLITEAHGTGRAATALSLLERHVRETYDYPGVTAHIKSANGRSLAFFRKMGYVDTRDYDADAKEVFLVKDF